MNTADQFMIQGNRFATLMAKELLLWCPKDPMACCLIELQPCAVWVSCFQVCFRVGQQKLLQSLLEGSTAWKKFCTMWLCASSILLAVWNTNKREFFLKQKLLHSFLYVMQVIVQWRILCSVFAKAIWLMYCLLFSLFTKASEAPET